MQTFLLSIELVPSTSWYNNLRSMLSPEAWDVLRKRVIAEHNQTCTICGFSSPFLHCHEAWEYDDELSIQRLTAILPLCTLCHAVKHMGNTMIRASKKEVDMDRILAHFCRINKCTKSDFQQHQEEMFALWEERSKKQWQIDIGPYQNVAALL